MIEIQQYLNLFQQKLKEVFEKDIFFFGIQGSYARGEATENSDIDIVVIFENLGTEQLLKYKNMIDTLPFREKLCGFVSGKQELLHWTASELFQFYYDTTPILGTLDDLLPLITQEKIKEAVKTAACTIYHSACHNLLHEKSIEICKALYKSAVFLLQAKSFLEKGIYSKTKTELLSRVSKRDAFILSDLQHEFLQQNLESYSIALIDWTSRIIISD
ncbi:nucleotidyltransferase domain-containing protein [Clostridium sp. MD294]|uniref:nucleotidyltransferase domain-containing protein n=1 Tax=Clostridium sp. MD294 TaxID=97138 RepID=UPI0002C8E346|nr:nucleotidyltransferase domain-containing protein [Clostridium sp. MD294]NDO46542.1 nucleotidyltransferase domain-containing protein [Clostridium sp. MD294]USF29027.1 hypothetical protein C820_000410 [Clostridium sp. MD294]